jgi:DNA-directed RNA polymerase specialized sigma24 family protein
MAIGPVNKTSIPGRAGGKLDLSRDTVVIPGEDTSLSFQLILLRALLLPGPRREVFLLKEIQGLPLPEVATLLGMSNDVARKHLRRARRDMQTSSSLPLAAF